MIAIDQTCLAASVDQHKSEVSSVRREVRIGAAAALLHRMSRRHLQKLLYPSATCCYEPHLETCCTHLGLILPHNGQLQCTRQTDHTLLNRNKTPRDYSEHSKASCQTIRLIPSRQYLLVNPTSLQDHSTNAKQVCNNTTDSSTTNPQSRLPTSSK
jgi:hypothetical protein